MLPSARLSHSLPLALPARHVTRLSLAPCLVDGVHASAPMLSKILAETPSLTGLTEGETAPGFTITASAAGLPPAAYDAVVSSLVLCSVDDVYESAADLYRWLRPGGTLLFLEHVADGQQTRTLHMCSKCAPLISPKN